MKFTGHLVAPHERNRTLKFLDDDDKLMMRQTSNSINDEYLMEPNINKTFFRSLNYSVIVSQVGSIVQIPCRVHLVGDEMVKSFSHSKVT